MIAFVWIASDLLLSRKIHFLFGYPFAIAGLIDDFALELLIIPVCAQHKYEVAYRFPGERIFKFVHLDDLDLIIFKHLY